MTLAHREATLNTQDNPKQKDKPWIYSDKVPFAFVVETVDSGATSRASHRLHKDGTLLFHFLLLQNKQTKNNEA